MAGDSSPSDGDGARLPPIAPTIRFAPSEDAPGSSGADRFPTLVVVGGAEADLGLHVRCDRPIVIGRDPRAELAIRDGRASRRHAIVEEDADLGGWVARDLDSMNGTRVGATRLTGNSPTHPLSEGAKIFIGGTVIKFTLTDEHDSDFHAKLESLVGRDELTGLLTRRKFDAALEQALVGARLESLPLVVLMMDLDGLKSINDRHGHHCGSHCITSVGALIGRAFANGDRACRFGGDEFIAFEFACDKERGLRLAESLRRSVEEAGISLDEVALAPTLSIGVAAFPEDGGEAESLSKAADAALYRAKAAGRNRVSD